MTGSKTVHEEVRALLSDPRTYGLSPGEEVREIETHAARVFLAGERAFKIKKPLDLGYLDYSSLEKRRDAAETEVRLNARTAPQLYLGVRTVGRLGDGTLALDRDGTGQGEAVDYAVEMRRFDNAGLFSELAKAGKLDLALVEKLAGEIARFHRAAEPVAADGAARAAAVLEEQRREFSKYAGDILDADKVDRANDLAARTLEVVAPLLRRRSSEGWLRRCHGDLHLRNIVAIDGEPVIFDCIEFSDAFTEIDVLYDLAFLLMDMGINDLAPQANRVLNGYLEAFPVEDDAGLIEGLAALPFFVALRAGIRCHIAALRASQNGCGGDGEHGREARAYLDLLIGTLMPATPRLVAVGGLSGTGKTTLARALAPDLGGCAGAVVLRSDVLRKRLFGVAPSDKLPERAYKSTWGRRVYAGLMERAALCLRAGQTAVIDAVLSHPGDREHAARIAEKEDVRFDGLWLDLPLDTALERVGAREGDASDATPDIVRRQQKISTGPISWPRLDTGDFETVKAEARRLLDVPPPSS